MPTRGPRRLLEQKHIVDALAEAGVRHIARYIVDSGGLHTADGRSVRLNDAIGEARSAERGVTLLIASLACLASTRALRGDVLTDLLAAGITVEDPSGSLQPTTMTVALAKAAVRRRAIRRSRQTMSGRRDA